MNADWIKRNGLAVVFLVGFVVFLGYDVWKLTQAIRHRREVETQLEQEKQRLQSLLRFQPFPVKENVEILRTSREEVEKLYGDIVRTAAAPVRTPPLNRVQFRAMLTQKLNDLNEAARDNKVTVPQNFAFGFDEYLGILPPDNKEALQALTKQLLVIERLSTLLFASKVTAITQIGRDDIKQPTTETAADALYDISHFELVFQATTPALQNFLNELSKQKWFFTVRGLDVQAAKISIEGPPLPRPAVPDWGRAPQPPLGPGGPLPVGPGGLPAAAPQPSRVEKDILEVKLRLDLVELKAPEAKTARRN